MSLPSPLYIAGQAINKQIEDIPSTYEYVYFSLDPSTIISDISKCYGTLLTNTGNSANVVKTTYKSSLQTSDGELTPVNELHTPESCKLNAGLLKSRHSWEEKMKPQTTDWFTANTNPKFTEITYINTPIKNAPGLTFTIYHKYHNDTDSDFSQLTLNPYVQNSGIIVDLVGLSTGLTPVTFDANNNATFANDPLISNKTGKPNFSYFTVEWFGYFKVPYTDSYTFYLNSDDGSYLWLGDNAMSGKSKMNNCLVNNRNLHGMRIKNGSMGNGATDNANFTTNNVRPQNGILLAGQLYPIRIRYGQNEGGYDFQLAITRGSGDVIYPPKMGWGSDKKSLINYANTLHPRDLYNNYTSKYKFPDNTTGPLFYTTSNPGRSTNNVSSKTSVIDTTPSNPLVNRDVYYALVENTPEDTQNNLFKCYIQDNTDETFNYEINNPLNNGLEPIVLWKALNDPKNPNSYKYRKVDNPSGQRTSIVINNDSTYTFGIYSGVQLVKTLATSPSLASARITDNGALKFGDVVVAQVGDSEVNKDWIKKYIDNINIIQFDTLSSPETLDRFYTYQYGEYSFIRYSSNGKYALMMDDTGNLLILGNQPTCSKFAKDGKTIYTQPSVLGTNNYNMYKIDDTGLNLAKLNKLFLVDNSTVQLTHMKGSNSILSNMYTTYSDYMPTPANIPITNNVKTTPEQCQIQCNNDPACSYYYTYKDNLQNPFCLLSTNDTDIDNGFPKTFIPLASNSNYSSSELNIRRPTANDSSAYANLVPFNSQSKIDAYKAHAVISGDSADKSALDKRLSEINVNTKIQNDIWTGREGLEGSNKIYSNIMYDPGVKSLEDVINKQVNPLQQEADQYSQRTDEVNRLYSNIDYKVNSITNNDNTGLRDVMLANAMYDFSGGHLQYDGHQLNSLSNAVVEDSQRMIYEQNSTYILGTIAAASLVIVSILLAKD